jgi:YcxB-like protein
MSSAAPEAGFSLTYELQPDDLIGLQVPEAWRRRQRTRLMYATVGWALIGAAFTAVIAAFDLPSVVKDSSGAPGWMYPIDLGFWFVVVYFGRIVWGLSLKRIARRAWRTNVQLHGRHHDEVATDSMTCTAPDGTQVIIPWASIDRIRETEHAFHLIDHHGAVRNSLPKRGLPSPDLIPALREFLNRSVDRQPPTATPGSAAGGSEA